MKLTLERDGLAEAVAWAARTLPARPTNPVLAGVLLSASEESLTLSSSDHAVSSQVAIPAEEVGEPGRSVVSGRLLADIAKALPPRPVTLNLEGTRLVVTCGRSVFTLPTLPVAEYPVLPDLPPTLGSCSGSTLAEAVAQVVIATSREDSVPMLTGIRLEFDADAITLSATDRYRMAMRRLGVAVRPVATRPHTCWCAARPCPTSCAPSLGWMWCELALDDSRSLIGISGAARAVHDGGPRCGFPRREAPPAQGILLGRRTPHGGADRRGQAGQAGPGPGGQRCLDPAGLRAGGNAAARRCGRGRQRDGDHRVLHER